MDQRPGEVMFWEEGAKAFPDRRFVVHKLWEVDGGDTVICHYSMIGTHSGGSFFGAPPTGKKVEINGTAILRFKDGKIVEHWGGAPLHARHWAVERRRAADEAPTHTVATAPGERDRSGSQLGVGRGGSTNCCACSVTEPSTRPEQGHPQACPSA